MTSKNYYLYYNVILKIKQLIKDLKININFNEISFMADFELDLRKALKIIFYESKIYGCFFHFKKNIYSEKAKKIGLFKKKL